MLRFLAILLIALTVLFTKPFLLASLFPIAAFVGLSFAIVGAGNRLAWGFVLPILLLLMGGSAYFLIQIVLKNSPFLQGLIGFGVLGTIPAVLFCLAHQFRKLREI